MYRLPYFKLLAQPSGKMTIKERYDIDRHDRRQSVLRLLCISLALFYLSYGVVDIYLLPDVGLLLGAMRFFIIVPLMMVLLGYLKRPISIRRKELACMLVVSIGTLSWCVGLLMTDDTRVLHYFYAGLVFQLSLTIVLANPFEYSVVASIFVCTCLYTIIWFLPGANAEYVINHLAVGVPTVILTLIANYRFSIESLQLYIQRLNAEELRAELARRNESLDRLSHIDPLTGLANRRGLGRCINTLVQNGRAPETTAVILIDVDYFKAFNDAYGHDAGDNCLIRIANTIAHTCGPNNTACRYGGEEFLVLDTESNSARSSALLAERIRMAVEALDIMHQRSHYGKITVSAGISTGLLDNDEALTQLIKAADKALYAAKNTGRNRVSEDPTGGLGDVQSSLFNPL